jgi:hypothetical protein
MTQRDIDDFHGSYENFQDPAFAAIFARTMRLNVVRLDGLVLLLSHKPLLGYMNGLLGSPDVIAPFIHWQEMIHGLNFAYLKVITAERIDLWQRYCVSPPDNHNMLVDLSLDEEGLFASFTRNCRRAIRAAKKKGVVVREAESEKDLRAFYQIVLEISDHGRNFDLWPINLIGELLRSKYAKLLVAVWEGRLVGGFFCLLSRHYMHGFFSGIEPAARQLTAGNLLYYEGALWGMAHGFKYLDFGQQGLRENPGIAKFKMSFNPILQPEYVYCVPGSWIKCRLIDFKKFLKSRARPPLITNNQSIIHRS